MRHFLDNADVILGIGCSFTETNFGVKMPKGPKYIHATLDPDHLDKDLRCDIGLLGDAGLVLDALLAELEGMAQRDHASVAAEITAQRTPWLTKWAAKRDSDSAAVTPP